jgi:hypothetical protein
MNLKNWIKLSGTGLSKVEELFGWEGLWYYYDRKFSGKTIFALDHGITTIYAIGNDKARYSMKTHVDLSCVTFLELKQLAEVAITGDLTRYPRAGIYRSID